MSKWLTIWKFSFKTWETWEKNKIEINQFEKKTINQYFKSFKSKRHNIFTEEINKIALSSNYY